MSACLVALDPRILLPLAASPWPIILVYHIYYQHIELSTAILVTHHTAVFFQHIELLTDRQCGDLLDFTVSYKHIELSTASMVAISCLPVGYPAARLVLQESYNVSTRSPASASPLVLMGGRGSVCQLPAHRGSVHLSLTPFRSWWSLGLDEF